MMIYGKRFETNGRERGRRKRKTGKRKQTKKQKTFPEVGMCGPEKKINIQKYSPLQGNRKKNWGSREGG